MTTSDMVRRLCKESHVSLSELARRVGQSPQNFSKKLQRETLTLDELNMIGHALGVSFEQSFVLANGRRISTETAQNVGGLSAAGVGIKALPSDHPLRKALTGDYNTVIYVDGPTRHCTFYALPEEARNSFGKVLDRNPSVGIVSSLLIENYVSPDDRREVSTFLDVQYLRQALSRTSVVSKIFRLVTQSGEKYSELRVVRIGEADKIQGAVIAIIDKDDMIREKVENDTMNRRLLAVTSSLACVSSIVIYVDMKKDTAWICCISEFIRNIYGNIEKKEVPFRKVMCPFIMNEIHPEDAENFEKALSTDSIHTGLAHDQYYCLLFRYNMDDSFRYAEMCISRYGDGSDPDSFVLAFLDRDDEIRGAMKHYDELLEARLAEERARLNQK